MADRRCEFRRFWESKTGYAFATLMAIAALGNLYNHIRTNPDNFSDLDSRFRIERSLDIDGINRLSISRNDNSPISPIDDDLVAFERKIVLECGDLSKFSGQPDTNGNVPVDFRLYRPHYNCSYLQDNGR